MKHRTALAYIRQSSARSDQDESVSLAFQEERIRAYASRNDLDVIAVYSDLDVSGNVESRSGLDAMLAHCQRPGIDSVIVYNISRLARDSYLFLKILRSLEKQRVQLLSTSESTEDKTIVTVLAAFSERERVTLSNNIANAVREQARRGLVTQAVPIGYARADGVLYPHEPDASTVRRIFREYTSGRSTYQIIDGLHADGIPTPAGKSNWRSRRIRGILSCRTYLGEIEISETRDPAGRVRPYLLTQGQHEPLIDRETWDLAQRKLAEAGWTRTKTEDNPWLAGRIRCSACGGKLYTGIKSRRNPDGSSRWYVKCSTAQLTSDNRSPNPCTGQASADLLPLESVARDTLFHCLQSSITPSDAYRASQARTVRQGGNRRDDLRTLIAQAESEFAELLDLRLRKVIRDGEFLRKRDQLETRIETLQAEFNAIPVETPLADYEHGHALIVSLADSVMVATDDELRSWLLMLDATATLDLRAKTCRWVFGGVFGELVG